jgi:hypothetical protein
LHGSEAVCMHQQEFRAIHWMPTSKKALKTVPSNPKPSIFTSPYEVNLQRAPARRCSPGARCGRRSLLLHASYQRRSLLS